MLDFLWLCRAGYVENTFGHIRTLAEAQGAKKNNL